MDSTETLVSVSELHFDVIRRHVGLVSGRMLNRKNQTFILVAKNIKLAAFVFKIMAHCLRYSSYLQEKHSTVQGQWELKQRKKDDFKVPEIDEINLTKTMEATVILLKFVKEMQGIPLANVVRQHVKLTLTSPGFDTYSNLDKEVTASAPLLTNC